MQDFYVTARPSPVDLMRNCFPHENAFSQVIVTTSLEEALNASQTLMPDTSPMDATFQHLQMPQAMIIYHTQGEFAPPVLKAQPGKPQQTSGTVFEKLKLKTMDVMLSDDPLHPAEAKKDKDIDMVAHEMHINLWSRVEKLEQYSQAVHLYTNTPNQAWQTWFHNVAEAEKNLAWKVPAGHMHYFNMYYQTSPFAGDVTRSAQYATAKVAQELGLSLKSGMQEKVLRRLEDNAMREVKDISALYGHSGAPKSYDQKLLRYTMPLLEQIHPADRKAFVIGVQSSAEIWGDKPAEDIMREAYHGFKRNHPAYKNSLDGAFNAVIDSMHSPVPMMVFGYWEGLMSQQYEAKVNNDIVKVFRESLAKSDGYSEMQRIGEAIVDAQIALSKQGYVLLDLPSGIEIAQKFTQEHLKMGMYTPVCFAWIPDDIRPDTELTYNAQSTWRSQDLAMTYALATGMAQCNQTHDSASMMRDISTVMNEVTMQAVKAGVDPRDMSALMNEAFSHTNDDVVDDFEEHN